MPTDGERLATVEAVLQELRGDMSAFTNEQHRTRERLHKLEGITGLMVNAEKRQRETLENRQRRIEVRLQLLTVVVAVAALLGPVIYHYLGVG